jgi:2-keto-4-pentenoate hydratase
MRSSGLAMGTPLANADVIGLAAQRLYEAQESQTPCEPVRDLLRENDIGGAYAVQGMNVSRWTKAGRRIVGQKIGLTFAAVQKAMGIDQPDFGTLFVDMEIPDGESVTFARLLQPRVEGELAFVLKSDIKQEVPSITDIIRAVDFVLPAIQIVDSRIRDWDIRIVDTIADNAAAGLYVLGANPVSLDDIDVRMCGMVLEQNGEVASTGAGIACLGHPLQAVRWLAKAMIEVGRPLCAGNVILSGALGPMVAPVAGDHVEVRISGAGSVSVRFAR